MKLGAVFPQTEIGNDPVVIRDYAQAVEGLGYDYLLAYEHVTGVNPQKQGWEKAMYHYQHTFHPPFPLFGFLAAVTQRLEFATGILVLPSRQTVLIAKQAAGIDVLSGGRLRLGVAVGWNPLEYQAMGVDIHTRGRRIEEQVKVLRALWTQPLVTFKGEFHTIDDLGINPMPVQRPIPIWIGGIAAPVLQRAARLADGWLPPALPLERAEKLVTRLHTYLEEVGRDLKGFGISARMKLSQANEWQDHLERWQSWGATHFELNTMGASLETPQAHIDALQRFRAILQS